MPFVDTRSPRRRRYIAGGLGFLLLAALAAPLAVLAVLTNVTPGTQAPNPVAAGSNATYNVQVTNTLGQARSVSITSISGLPAGASLLSSTCVGIASGDTETIVVVVATTAGTTPVGTYPISMTATRRDNNSSNCTGGVNDTLSGSGQLVVGKADQTITFNALPDKTIVDPDFAVSATASSGLTVTFTSTTASVCTVTGTTVHLVTLGTCTVKADQAGNTQYNPAPSVSRSFSVTKASQTITFGALANKTFDDADFGVSATSSSGLTVTFTSTTTGICTVTGTTVHIVAVGTCTIQADQAGNANYNAAPSVSQSFTVGKSNQTISFGALADKTYGDADFGVAATASSGLTVTFTSTTPSTCTVSGTTVHIVAAGGCTIKADQAGDANYNAATSVFQSFNVAKADADCSSIAGFSGPYDGAAHGASGDCFGVDGVTPLAGLDLGASFTDVPGGTADWTFTDSTGNYNDDSGSVAIDIAKADADCSSIAGFSGPYDGAAHGASGDCFGVDGVTPLAGLDLGASFTDVPGGTADWTFTDSTGNYNDDSGSVAIDIAKADADCSSIAGFSGPYDGAAHGASGDCFGVDGVTPLAGLDLGASFTDVPGGTADWTFTDSTGNYNDDSGSVAIDIAKADADCSSIAGFSGPYDGAAHGASGDCFGVDGVTPLAGLDLGASFTDVPGGTADWTFTDSTGNYNDDSGSVSIDIAKADADCSSIAGFSGPYDGAAHGASGDCFGVDGVTPLAGLDLGASFTDVPGGTADWTFTDSTGNYNDDSGSVAIDIAKAAQTINFGALAGKTYGNADFGVSATASSGLTVTFSSTTASVCTVSGTTVHIVAAGTCTIKADQAGDATYSAAPSVSQSFTVAKADAVIVVNGFSGTYNGAPHGATGSATGVFAEDLSADLDLGATFTNAPGGTADWTFTDTTGNYNDDSGSVAITIAKANQTITFGALAGKTYGNADFGVSATASSGLTVTFSSTTTSVCTVSGTTVHIVAAGTCTIRANQAGNGNYNAAPAVSRSFTVAKANQTITFGALAGKTYGNADFGVSATASSGLTVTFSSTTTSVCTVSGTTVHIVAAGTCTIKADQAGNGNYNAASAVSRSFTVAKANQTITFGALTDKTLGAPDFTVSATASSGLTVSFSSATASVCTVSGATVHLVAAGTCTIRANQAGNGNYNAAPQVSRSFTVSITKADQTISFGALADKTFGAADFSVSATASSGLTVTFSSATASVCTVSGTTVHVVAAGTCTIKADQAGNASYNAAPQVSRSFTVAKANQTITFGTLADKTLGAADFAVSATASSGLTVSFSSTTSSVCTVSGSTVHLVAAGTCTIKASQAGNANYNAAPAVSRTFTVSNPHGTVTRIYGDDRYATAAKLSAKTFAPGVAVVYIATGENYPDALAGGPAAAHAGGPVLLVRQSTIPAIVATELDRLNPGRIVVLGGPAVVSNAVKTALGAYTSGSVTRIYGSDRYETAAKLSAKTFSPGVSVVYIATGQNFPDALTAGPAAGKAGGPILLVTQNSIPKLVADELARLNPAKIVVLGGPAVVSNAVKTALGAYTTGTVTRINGIDRYATAAKLSAKTFAPGVSIVYIATGQNFPDALAGGPAAAKGAGPVLLVRQNSIPALVAAELGRLAPANIVVLGGPAVVSDGVKSALAAYLAP